MKNWELSFGFYPGILIGFRTYNEEDRDNHVLYIPLVDVCLTIFNDQGFEQKNTFRLNSPYEVC